MKRQRQDSDNSCFLLENEHCKRIKPQSILILLDQNYNSPTLTRTFRQKQKGELCNHTLAFLFSRLVFDQQDLERTNFFDHFNHNEIPRELVFQILLHFKSLCARDVKRLTTKYRNDREIMLTAIGNYHFAAAFASKKLQNERKFVKKALCANNHCLNWFSKKFHSEIPRKIALESVKNVESCPLLKSQMHNSISMDEFLNSPRKKCSLLDSPNSPYCDFLLTHQETPLEDILEFVRRDGLNLRLLDSDYSYDRSIVMEAIKSNGYALKFANSSFRNDKATVLFALDQPYEKMFKVVEQIDYLGDDMIADREVVLHLLIGASKRKFKVDWIKYDMEKILFDQEFILEVYKALF